MPNWGEELEYDADDMRRAKATSTQEEGQRIRRTLAAWIKSREDLHKSNVAHALLRDLRATLNEIIPEP